MNFAEVRFWVLLLSGLAVLLGARVGIAAARPSFVALYDKVALLGLGLFLLAKVSAITFIIFLTVAIGTYWALMIVQRIRENARPYALWIIIPLQLLPLIYYKYGAFITHEFWGEEWNTFRDLVIPVGISFYTFQKIAFAVDTLSFRQPLPRFLDYLNFAAFFPQIVAGPIERRNDLLPQMQEFRFRWSPDDVYQGVSYIVLGLFFKCCLADNIVFILTEFPTPDFSTNPFAIWLGNMLFGLRIYYDFSGYSMVALGLARCFGVKLTLNFASPYCSTSATEFWRRWHVTLSQWFRDYVYFPLGGGRTAWWSLNVAIVFLLSGIWHGAGWNFVLWGALHGVCLIVHRLFSRRVRLPAVLGWFLTMLVVGVTWLCFYETRTAVLLEKLRTILRPTAYTLPALRETLSHWVGSQGLVLLSILSVAMLCMILEWLSLYRRREPYWYLRRPVALAVFVTLLILFAPSENNGFIYFAF